MANFPSLSKSRKKEIQQAAVKSLIGFINLFGEQPFNQTDLLKKITHALASGEPVQVIDVHCPPFRHTAKGIEVIPSAKDQILPRSDGRKTVVSQWDILDQIGKANQTFRQNGVPSQIIVAIVDIDEFAFTGQEENVKLFCDSLRREMTNQKFEAKIRLVSEITGVNNLDSPKINDIHQKWTTLKNHTHRLAMRLVDNMFERLQKTTLPAIMKEREFATQMAGRRFAIHFLLGRSLPVTFPQGIIMLRARGSEASEIDRLGAKSANQRPLLVNHWQKRKIID